MKEEKKNLPNTSGDSIGIDLTIGYKTFSSTVNQVSRPNENKVLDKVSFENLEKSQKLQHQDNHDDFQND